jgi:hypothetical protein
MRTSLLILCCLLVGCVFSRQPKDPISLTLPAPEASFEERLSAYERLAPKRVGVIVVTSSNGGSSRTPYVTLQNDQSFYNPSDLLDVIATDTPMSRLVAERDGAWKMRRFFLRSGIAAVGAGLLLVGVADLSESDAALAAGVLASGVLTIAGGSLAVVSYTWRMKASTANERALLTYEFSLRKTLGVCYDDLKEAVYDCKNPPSYLP